MKFEATVLVKLRGSVSDAAGNAVMNNTNRVAPNLKSNLLRIGKVIDYWFEAKDYETAEKELYKLSDLFLANTVIEDWEYEFHETEETGIGNISNDNAGTSKHHLFEGLKHGGYGSMRWVASLTKKLNPTTTTLFWYVLLFSYLISSLTVLLLQGS